MVRLVALAAKLAISVGLIWYAFGKIDASSAFRELRGLAPWAAAAGLSLIFAQFAIAASRLRLILASIGSRLTFAASFDAVLIGAFFSQALISFVGGDGMRVWRMTRKSISVGDAVRAVLYDRIFGFVGLIILIVAELPSLLHIVQDRRIHASLFALIGCSFVGCVVLLSLHRLPAAAQQLRVFRFASELARLGHELLRTPRRLLALLVISIAIQAANVLAIYTIARGIGSGVELGACFVLVPPVMFLAMMPISFAGWGIRESTMVAFLAMVNVPTSQSLALSVCYGLGVLLASLPGGILWLFIVKKRPTGNDATVTI